MPCDYGLYPANWQELRALVLEEQGHKCAWCGVPNGRHVPRGPGGWWYEEDADLWHTPDGRTVREEADGYVDWEQVRRVRIVLTVAHLDHDVRNNERGNLAGLCQACHLRHDAAQHAASARRTRMSRRAAGPLPGLEVGS